jgi:hypothetical protein
MNVERTRELITPDALLPAHCGDDGLATLLTARHWETHE